MPETAVATERLTYAKAINAALDRALQSFPEALLFGEDVALPGGVFGCTRGLHEKYGDRVFDTPISETGFLGAAIGAAMVGRRPIVEVMWVEFTLVAFDQIVNQAPNVRYVSEGRLQAPLTVRTQQGILPGSCAQHSQSLEALFAHFPGLRVAMPASPQDAYDLLLAAIASDDPTVVIEHRSLYQKSSEVELGGEVQSVGGGRTLRSGSDATVVALGPMVAVADAAAEILAEEEIEVELIDPRWVAPLDIELIAASVERTGRLVIVHEANVTGGIGAEIAAGVARHCFWSLEAPIERLGLPDVRVPAAPHLQQMLLPTPEAVVAAVHRTREI
jgi:acetoin:2,6-dichlorophenolindophenol oxidoreductase subunit beta